MIDFEKDADALQVQDDDIAGIAGLAKRAKELREQIEKFRIRQKTTRI